MTFSKGTIEPTITKEKMAAAIYLAKAYTASYNQAAAEAGHSSLKDVYERGNKPEVTEARNAFMQYLDGLSDDDLRSIEVLYCMLGYRKDRYIKYVDFAENWDDLAVRFPNPTHKQLVDDVNSHVGLVAKLSDDFDFDQYNEKTPRAVPMFEAGRYPASLSVRKLLQMKSLCEIAGFAFGTPMWQGALDDLSVFIESLDQTALREVEALCAYRESKATEDDIHASYEVAWDELAAKSPNPTKKEQVGDVMKLRLMLISLFK